MCRGLKTGIHHLTHLAVFCDISKAENTGTGLHGSISHCFLLLQPPVVVFRNDGPNLPLTTTTTATLPTGAMRSSRYPCREAVHALLSVILPLSSHCLHTQVCVCVFVCLCVCVCVALFGFQWLTPKLLCCGAVAGGGRGASEHRRWCLGA